MRRTPVPHDRRTQTVRLTPAGLEAFRPMAARHERWIAERFSALSADELERLLELSELLRRGQHGGGVPAAAPAGEAGANGRVEEDGAR